MDRGWGWIQSDDAIDKHSGSVALRMRRSVSDLGLQFRPICKQVGYLDGSPSASLMVRRSLSQQGSLHHAKDRQGPVCGKDPRARGCEGASQSDQRSHDIKFSPAVRQAPALISSSSSPPVGLPVLSARSATLELNGRSFSSRVSPSLRRSILRKRATLISFRLPAT